MSTIHVRGQDVRVGDDLWFLSTPKRITRIEPYTHALMRGEAWRVAYSDGPAGMYKNAWGITLEYGSGYAANYEVTALPGDDREQFEPDWTLSPWTGEGARLWEAHQAEIKPGGWRGCLAARQAEETRR
jgi:hypothetical protein